MQVPLVHFPEDDFNFSRDMTSSLELSDGDSDAYDSADADGDAYDGPDAPMSDNDDIITLDDFAIPLAAFEGDDHLILDDLDVPLASFMSGDDVADHGTLVEIEDMAIPMGSMMPQTGLADVSTVLMSGMFISALIAGVTAHSIRKLAQGSGDLATVGGQTGFARSELLSLIDDTENVTSDLPEDKFKLRGDMF
jgi:hypothetical protein